MALPKIPLLRKTVEIDGHSFEIRQLSAGESLRAGSMGDDGEIQVFALSCALGESLEDTRSWIEVTPPLVVKELTEAVVELSDLMEDADRPTSGT